MDQQLSFPGADFASGPVIVAFDFETSGLSPKRAGITEIGAVKFDAYGVILGTFQELTHPGQPIPPEIVALTGITDAMVAEARSYPEVAADFARWAGPSALLAAHNAGFDAGFLREALARANMTTASFTIIDTLRWARTKNFPTPDHKLGTLLAHIAASTNGLHRALADAYGVMALVLHLLDGSKSAEKELARWRHPLENIRPS